MTEQQIVGEVMRARSVALVNRDGDALSALLHPEFVYTDTKGRLRGREEYVAFTTAGEGHWVDQAFEGIQVASEGSVVIVTARVVDHVRWNEELFTWRFATTQVYVPDVDGHLLYRAGHTSGDG